MMDANDIMKSRLMDLADRSEKYVYPVYSKFLTVPQQQIARSVKTAGTKCALWGGFVESERKVAAFYPDYMEEADLPWNICPLEIRLTDGRERSHRDYLGSLLALGIKRETLGDILVEAGRAVVFCLEDIAPFIQQNLDKVGGSRAEIVWCAFDKLKLPEKRFQTLDGTVASLRLDAVVGFVCGKSRKNAADIIRAGLVEVNFMPCSQGARLLKESDILSVRGYGKFQLEAAMGQTRKGRESIKVKKYI